MTTDLVIEILSAQTRSKDLKIKRKICASFGIQGVPSLTVRENTEWPLTVDVGSNILVGRDMELLKREARRALEGNGKKGAIPILWDGHASERIADILVHWKR